MLLKKKKEIMFSYIVFKCIVLYLNLFIENENNENRISHLPKMIRSVASCFHPVFFFKIIELPKFPPFSFPITQ